MVAKGLSTMKLRLVETHTINQPPNLASSTTKILPLTFSDAFWIPFSSNTQRIFFYNFPSISTQYFLTSFLPNLKTSLSTSLQLFFPLAGSFSPPTHPSSKPFILCEDGCSSVTLTIAEAKAKSFDFNHLVGTDKRRMINVTEFHPLVPDLVVDEDESTGQKRTSLLALQVTIFPEYGICFGITYKHVVADGKSIATFLNTWASICNNNCIVPDNTIMPVFDRSLIPDPNGIILESYLKQIFALSAADKSENEGSNQAEIFETEIRVRGTFVITKSEIQKLRLWILSKRCEDDEELHLSTFVLACSLIWVNLIKSEAALRNSDVTNSETEMCYFGQVVDLRDRYELKSIVPKEYFGNCLSYGSVTQAKRTELEGEEGLLVAVTALGNQIKKLESDGALVEAENWLANYFAIVRNVSVLSVAGSHRLGFYGLDFGWGRPVKVEVVSIEKSNSISIAESVGDEGGVEIGLVLGMAQMEAFVSIHEKSNTKYCGSCW